MFSQFQPGRKDTSSMRLKWFQSCLICVEELSDLKSIAFPYGIGCGAAGGHWPHYLECIKEFASRNPHVDVRIYKL